MTKRLASLGLLLCIFAAPAWAADPGGTWAGQITDPGGNSHPITLVLAVNGNKVTGSLIGGPPMGATQPIENGALNGDDVSFDIKASGPGGDVLMSYKGKISGNHIEGTNTSQMGSLPWDATKKQ